MQIEVIRVKGHWIFGGNIVFPFLMAMLLWWCPRMIRDFRKQEKTNGRQFKRNVFRNTARFKHISSIFEKQRHTAL